jgi:hypothetical protein
MSAPTLPGMAVNVIHALYGEHVDLAHGDDDRRRQLTRMISEQLRYDLGPGWGTKSADLYRPPSKDAIAYFDGFALWGWDWQNGTTREPQVVAGQEAAEISGQHFIAVEPINHLGTVPNPGTPPPTPGMCDCAAELAQMRAGIADLLQRAHDAEALPQDALERAQHALDGLGRLKVQGESGTSRDMFHAHRLRIELPVRVAEE